jgi:hypothetical protein
MRSEENADAVEDDLKEKADEVEASLRADEWSCAIHVRASCGVYGSPANPTGTWLTMEATDGGSTDGRSRSISCPIASIRGWTESAADVGGHYGADS